MLRSYRSDASEAVSPEDSSGHNRAGEELRSGSQPRTHTLSGPLNGVASSLSAPRVHPTAVSKSLGGVRPMEPGSIYVDWSVVLNELQGEKKRAIARHEQQYQNRSFFLFSGGSKIREVIIKIVEWPVFDRLVLLLIVCNCIFLMLDDPVCRCTVMDDATDGCQMQSEMYKRMLFLGKNCDNWSATNDFLGASEYVFTALFTVELLLKIVARGLILHKHAFLRDGMNWLDFIVVSASLFSLSDSGTSFSFLRTVRVMRPLRTLTRIKQMRPLINTFIRSLYSLVNVVMLLLFFMLVYGIIGIELLSGVLRGRCYFDPKNNVFPPSVEARLFSQQIPYLVESLQLEGAWNPDTSICSLEMGEDACDPQVINGAVYNTTCSVKQWCNTDWCDNLWNENPYGMGGGFLSYDNFGSALLTIIQVLTNEGWVDVMYSYQDGLSVWGSRVFHISWVLLGSFFVIQLALAVLSHSFVQAQEEEETAKEREALHEEAILQVPPAVHVKNTYEKVRKQQILRDQKTPSGTIMMDALAKEEIQERDVHRGYSNESIGMVDRLKVTAMFITRVRNKRLRSILDSVASAYAECQKVCRVIVRTSHFENIIIFAIFLNAICLACDFHDQGLYEESICKRRCDLDMSLPADASEKCTGPLFNRTYSSDGAGGGERMPQTGRNFCFMDYHESLTWTHGCAAQMTAEDCWMADPDCRWFEGQEQPCKHGIYNYSTLAQERGMTLSLRHICGDHLTQCITYPPTLDLVISNINQVLTFFFIGEMMLKLVGLGINDYFSDYYNVFDFFVVASSIFEIVLQAVDTTPGGGGSKLSALRGMRLFRLFKLARSWKSMRKILATMGVALGSLWPLSIVWAMFMYIFGLLGMQTVGNQFKTVKTDSPRSNFDYFWPSEIGHGAFVVTFQIITTENWNSILYNCITSAGVVSSLFPIAIVIFGNYIIMNLFISILLQGFDEDDEVEDEEVHVTMMDRFRRLLGRTRNKVAGRLGNWGSSLALIETPKTPGIEILKDLSSFASGIVTFAPREMVNFRGQKVPVADHKAFCFIPRKNPFRVLIAYIAKHSLFDTFILCCIFVSSISLIIEKPEDSIMATEDQCPSLGLDCRNLQPGHTFYVNCPRSVSDDGWNTFFGACGTPEENGCCATKAMLNAFSIMDQIFTTIFLIEMLMKMIADGVIFHEKAYLRDAWNWLDFIIVIVSMLSTFGSDMESIKSFKSLRALRALRPLRVIKRNPGLKIVVVALLSSIPAMLNVAVVFLLWFSMYAMLGTQFFKGKLFSCMNRQDQLSYGYPFFASSSTYTASEVISGSTAVPTIIECVSRTQGLGTWDDKYWGFDYYPRGLMTLFEMATTEGWMDVMAATSDITEVGVTPIANFSPAYSAYSVLHIVVGAFVLLNLIVGSIINNYNRIKSTSEGIPPFLTAEQQEWKETRKIILQMKPLVRIEGPTNTFRKYCFILANHHYFDAFTTSVIGANVIVMTLKMHDESECVQAAKVWINISFTVIFILEAIIKIIGLGPRGYIRDGWNAFDLIVAIFSVVSVGFDITSKTYTCDPALKEGVTENNVPALLVLRAFRIARVFKLVRRARGLRNMIQTLIVSIPALGNIMGLIGIFIVIFAVLGNTLFFNVSFDQDFFGRMDDNANYKNFENSVFLLLRQTTGEAWNGVMYYCSEADPYRACARTDELFFREGCGNPVTGRLFHLFWQLFGTYLMMQLFTAVIIENFDDVSKDESSVMPVDRLNEFVDAWTELDPKANRYIPSSSLPILIMKLPPPLGVKMAAGSANVNLLQIIKDLAIPIRGGNVHYQDSFLACVKRVMAHEVDDGDKEDFEDDVTMPEEEANKQVATKGFNGQAVTVAEDFAARLVQRAYRDWREKKMQVEKAVGMTRSIPLSGDPSIRVVNW